MRNLNVSDVLPVPVKDSRPPMSRKKSAVNSAVKNWEVSIEIIRGEGESQPQRIGDEIIRPRDRATHGNKQVALERQNPNLGSAKMFMREKIC